MHPAMIAAMRRMRTVNPVVPSEQGAQDGLAYSVWLPPDPVRIIGAVVILHGAGSCKESHYDYARAALPLGLAAVTFDQRGHGESAGPMDARVIRDVAAMATLVRGMARQPALPVALRGSSMGGYLAIVAAEQADAAAVVAICPAGNEALRQALRRERPDGTRFEVDAEALDSFLSEHDLGAAASLLEVPLLLLHAEGDEQVPVQHSRELASDLANPHSRLITVPGGHHRSVQHDPELQAISLRFIVRTLTGDR